MEAFEKVGIWWFSHEARELGHELFGTLSFDPDTGGSLALVIHCDAYGPIGLSDIANNVDIIYGLVQGNPVTLKGCYIAKNSHHNPGFDEAVIAVEYIFLGHHFERLEDIVFHELSLGYTHLDSWMQEFGFDVFRIVRTTQNQMGEVSHTEFEYPPKVVNSRISVQVGYEISTGGSLHGATFSNKARVAVIATKTLSIDECLEYIDFHIANFLTLATGHVNYPVEITGSVPDVKRQIRIYYRIPGYIEHSNFLTPWHMLFTFADIKDDFNVRLTKWSENAGLLWSAYDLYFKLYYQKCLDTKTRFLCLVQSLEAYHRALYGDKKRKLEDRVEEVIKRLKEQNVTSMREFISDEKDYALVVAKTRHNLSHHPKNVYQAAYRMI